VSAAWPPGHGPRVLIADAWGTNTGDAAITVAAASALRRALPGVRLLACQSHPRVVAPHYPELVMADSLAELVRTQPELVAAGDAVVSQGGGFLFEHYPSEWRLDAHLRVLAMGVPLALWGQSVGLYEDERARAKLGRVLAGARAFVARDQVTLDHLERMGIRPRRAALGADLALMLPVARRARPGATIGLTLTPTAAMPAGAAARERPPDLVERHAELAARLLADGPPLRAFSTIQGLRRYTDEVEDDGLHHAAIRERLPAAAAERFELVEGFLPLKRFVAALDGLDVLVSARLHAGVVAMLHGIPAVYVSPNFKGAALFERLGLSELVVPDTEPDLILPALDRARALRPALGRRIALLRREARRSTALVTAALGLDSASS
jgi:polysaccharide pyruvyl transferase WcaK-like protein